VEWNELMNESVSRQSDIRWGTVVVSRSCETLVAEARGQFGHPEKWERRQLEAVIRQ
jgi:hypothetical protein